MAFVKIGDLSELWVGEIRRVQAQTRHLVVLRTNDGVFAYEDRCPHLGYPLSQGKLEESTLTCAAHGWQFEVCTGQGVNPRNEKLNSFEVQVRGDQIWVDLA